MKAVLPAADNISVYFCIYIFKTQNENENKVMFLFIIDSKGCRGEVPAELKSLHSLKIMNSSSASVQTQNTGGLYAIIKILFKFIYCHPLAGTFLREPKRIKLKNPVKGNLLKPS